MLFDLKGKRKRLVQVVYLGLAILFGGGLVLFGVGGNVSGGLGRRLQGHRQRGHERLQRPGGARRAPRGAPIRASRRRWLDVVRAQFNLASSPEGSDAETGQLTDRGQQAIIEVAQAWERYLRLKPEKVDASAASFAALAYGALQDYDKAVETQRSLGGVQAERERLLPAGRLRLPRGAGRGRRPGRQGGGPAHAARPAQHGPLADQGHEEGGSGIREGPGGSQEGRAATAEGRW